MSVFRVPQATVWGAYRLTRLITSGRTARVYEGYRLGAHGFERRVVIKRIHAELAGEHDCLVRCCAEARLQASFNHPNLLQVVDFEEYDGELFLALEYVDGMTCADLVERVAARRRRVDVGVALFVVREVLRGLEYIHELEDEHGVPRALVHGVLEPSKVLIGSAGQVKLGEFGLRRAAGTSSAPRGAGRSRYASPERLLGKSLDPRSDVYGAGIVLAEMLLTGPLFNGSTDREVEAAVKAGDLSRLRTHGWHLPDDVRRILELALSVHPEERYPSIAAFRDEVEAALQATGGPSSSYELVEWLSSLGLVDLQSGVWEKEAPAPNTPRSSYRPTQARQYRVRTAAGHVEEPCTAAALLRRIATGALEDDVWIARGEEPFAPLTNVPELQGLWARHPYRFWDPPDPGAARCPIEEHSLPQRLFAITLANRSGLLRAQSASRQIRIYFEQGKPVFSSSTNADSLLGVQLEAAKIVSAGAIEACLALGWNREEPLGERLVARGFLSKAALHSSLELQMEHRLTELASFRCGELVFTEGARPAMREVPVLRSGPALVARALLRAYSLEELGRLLLPLWHSELRLTRRADVVLPLLELGEEHGAWLERARAGVLPSAIVREVQGDRALLTRALGSLVVGLASGALGAPGFQRGRMTPQER